MAKLLMAKLLTAKQLNSRIILEKKSCICKICGYLLIEQKIFERFFIRIRTINNEQSNQPFNLIKEDIRNERFYEAPSQTMFNGTIYYF